MVAVAQAYVDVSQFSQEEDSEQHLTMNDYSTILLFIIFASIAIIKDVIVI